MLLGNQMKILHGVMKNNSLHFSLSDELTNVNEVSQDFCEINTITLFEYMGHSKRQTTGETKTS